jgi:homoserine kinase
LSEIFLRAPATIANFGPGFDVFALALDAPFDLFKIRRTDSGTIGLKIVNGRDSLPIEAEKNTAGLAAIHFFKKTGLRCGVEIDIIKKMPIGSGLGSSAASAVAAAYGLNRLYQTGLDVLEMIEIASQGEAASGGTPHADNVSACFLGGFVLIRSRYPLRVDRLDVAEIPIVIRVRRKSLITSRGLIPERLPMNLVKEQMAWCAALVHAVATGDLQRIGECVNVDHISEPVRSRYIGGYKELKKRALDAGAMGVNVSGGGSSVFAICEKDREQPVAEVLRAEAGGETEPPLLLRTKSSNWGVVEIDGL